MGRDVRVGSSCGKWDELKEWVEILLLDGISGTEVIDHDDKGEENGEI